MHCKSCGNNHQENYCPACGEKAFHPKQLSVKHFVEETFEGLIHFDSKFLRTFKVLVAKPGQLSIDYTEGRRVRYMKPIQFFLVTNLLYFFLIFNGNIYSLQLYNYTHFYPFISYNTNQIITEKLQRTGLSMPEYAEIFNEKMHADSKEFIFLFIPVYGLMFWLLLFWKKTYFVEHLVFATHFMAFVLLLTFISYYAVTLPYYKFISKTNYSQMFDNLSSLVTATAVAVYLSIAIRKFYKANIFWGITVSLIGGGTFFYLIQYYRMLLFYKILYLG